MSNATISDSASVHPTAKVWNGAHVREGAVIGVDVIIGEGAYIGIGVLVGASCKIQNRALVYEPALLEDGVFIGPGAILTNDHLPRAINPDGTQKRASDWSSVGVTVRTGASIGAGAICVAPVEVGAFALVGAGSVVTRDVPAFALVVGNPARQIGWVGRSGHRLLPDGPGFACPSTGERYAFDEDGHLALVAG